MLSSSAQACYHVYFVHAVQLMHAWHCSRPTSQPDGVGGGDDCPNCRLAISRLELARTRAPIRVNVGAGGQSKDGSLSIGLWEFALEACIDLCPDRVCFEKARACPEFWLGATVSVPRRRQLSLFPSPSLSDITVDSSTTSVLKSRVHSKSSD